jgi:hypothetical protein
MVPGHLTVPGRLTVTGHPTGQNLTG